MRTDEGVPLLAVENLSIEVPAGPTSGRRAILKRFDLRLGPREIVGLVGESGSGKTSVGLAILGLLPRPARIASGRILLDGVDLLGLSEGELRRLRGGTIGMVFQEPLSALNPVLRLGDQIAETVGAHLPLPRSAARARALELLALVGFRDAGRIRDAFPHQLSGGQRQRAMLAIALAGSPKLLVADEPTTALDTILQEELLELLDRLRRELSLAILLVTHDLAAIAQVCDRALVLGQGEVVEEGAIPDLFASPTHAHTRELVAAVAALEPAR